MNLNCGNCGGETSGSSVSYFGFYVAHSHFSDCRDVFERRIAEEGSAPSGARHCSFRLCACPQLWKGCTGHDLALGFATCWCYWATLSGPRAAASTAGSGWIPRWCARRAGTEAMGTGAVALQAGEDAGPRQPVGVRAAGCEWRATGGYPGMPEVPGQGDDSTPEGLRCEKCGKQFRQRELTRRWRWCGTSAASAGFMHYEEPVSVPKRPAV